MWPFKMKKWHRLVVLTGDKMMVYTGLDIRLDDQHLYVGEEMIDLRASLILNWAEVEIPDNQTESTQPMTYAKEERA